MSANDYFMEINSNRNEYFIPLKPDYILGVMMNFPQFPEIIHSNDETSVSIFLS